MMNNTYRDFLSLLFILKIIVFYVYNFGNEEKELI